MSAHEQPKPEEIGRQLRKEIQSYRVSSGRNLGHLSRSIGAQRNYISSFLRTGADVWAMPKTDKLFALLGEIGVSHEELIERTIAAREVTQ